VVDTASRQHASHAYECRSNQRARAAFAPPPAQEQRKTSPVQGVPGVSSLAVGAYV